MKSKESVIEDLCEVGADALSSAYATGKISPVEVTKAALARAESINKELNAFTVIDHEGAMLAAKASEDRWLNGTPLSAVDGIPTTIKDMVHCHDLDVRYGSQVTSDVSNKPDSPSVERLRKSGTVILGLTTTPEFGWKAVTDNPRNGITRNPWDASKTPGGSSGGAAVAAATGAGVFHLGTDGGGSIRIPASFCGIVGHKPSFGRVPAYPPSAFGTVAHIGPMARTVSDTAFMLNAMSGRDNRDWNQGPAASSSVNVESIDWKKQRIAFWSTPCVGSVDNEVYSAVRSVVHDLELAGAQVDDLKLPMQDDLLEIFYRHWYVGAANRLSTIDASQHKLLDPGFLDAATKGARYTSVERMQAEVMRGEYGAQMDMLLEEYDYIISPTLPITAFDAGMNVPADSGCESWVEWCSFSFPINLSQQPACTVPCGQSTQGLPIGLQIIGARGGDEKVLSAASTYEQMYPDRFISAGNNWPNYTSKK